MLRERLLAEISASLARETENGALPNTLSQAVEISETKNPDHGDFATNYALVNAKSAGLNPRALAETLAASLRNSTLFDAVEIAGPGFLNFRLRKAVIAEYAGTIIEVGTDLANTQAQKPLAINVEFVSVNPNGPVTVGSGRGAAFGDTLCRVLRATGHQVDAEFYINDALNSQQMRLFAESVQFYLAELGGAESTFPEGGYKGDYVREVAETLHSEGVANWETPIDDLQELAQSRMIAAQRRDLAAFGVEFQRWFSEQSMHLSGFVGEMVERLQENGTVDNEPHYAEKIRDDEGSHLATVPQEPGPLWLRSTRFGDEKDRVIVRSDGRPAYIAGDLAYLEQKLGVRKYDKAILIVGPDHHGYIGRMYAVCQALGYSLEKFKIIIFQIVRFVKDGQPAPMRKRDGNIYELRDLVNELGKDVVRFFYLMRSHETHMDFDIDLATKQSDDNPVFYVQYAHARIQSVLNKAVEAGLGGPSWDPHYATLLEDARELNLLKKCLELPEEVRRCADDYGVHRLTTYAVELSRTYHHFYDGCRVVQIDEPELSRARVCLCRAAQIALKATLDLLGISAPERMDRPVDPALAPEGMPV